VSRPYTIVVQAFDLTDAEAEALFDRVADAAHANDEQLFCFGGADLEVVRLPRPPLLRRDAATARVKIVTAYRVVFTKFGWQLRPWR
jgi:hypothetical protein